MYKLNEVLLNKYAQVLVHYGLNWGEGIKKGETVLLIGQECSKDLFMAICKCIWQAGGNVITGYLPDEMDRYGVNRPQLEIATNEQLSHFPINYWKGAVDDSDHLISIIAEPNVGGLNGISSDKIAMLSNSKAPFMQMFTKKEGEGKITRTLCLYGTQSMADEAGMSIEEYWQQIINACYLEDDDPIASWRKTRKEIILIKEKLNQLQIKELHIEGEGIDLRVLIGENRKWLGASGRNIPSFEIFISPDWRGTNGTIAFNQPLYYNGKRVSGIKLKFENGLVVEASAKENEDALLKMISNKNADKIGEFSLTDSRHSRITKFMATTLFDENMGGKYGNTHIALGNAYKDTYTGNIATMTGDGWEAMGFNQCPEVHTDIISTTDRKVTATLPDGQKIVIYENGQFTLV